MRRFTPMILIVFFSVISGPFVSKALEFEGVIEPSRIVNLGGAGVPGILETVNVDRGEYVRKGQVIASLQAGVERATMELAKFRAEMEAGIKAKEANLNFYIRKKQMNEELYKKQVLPFSQMDEIETNKIIAEWQLKDAIENKKLAELEYKRALEAYQRMTIRSPINGIVVERFLSPGEYIESQAILKLAQIDPLNVEIVLPVSYLLRIKVGMKAKVIPEAPISGEYVAVVKVIDRVIDAASGTFGVRLELPNPGYKLPAGLKCKVIF